MERSGDQLQQFWEELATLFHPSTVVLLYSLRCKSAVLIGVVHANR